MSLQSNLKSEIEVLIEESVDCTCYGNNTDYGKFWDAIFELIQDVLNSPKLQQEVKEYNESRN